MTDETYTEAALKRKNLDDLGEIAEAHDIDPETHEDKASLIAAILAAQGDDDAADEPDEPEVPEGLVLVVGLTAPDRISLWEQHRDHPGGELTVRGGERAAAALTPGVQRAVRELRVRIVDGK